MSNLRPHRTKHGQSDKTPCRFSCSFGGRLALRELLLIMSLPDILPQFTCPAGELDLAAAMAIRGAKVAHLISQPARLASIDMAPRIACWRAI